MADNLDCIKLDDLDMEQRALADIIGIEAYRALIAAYGGTEIYVPKLDGFCAPSATHEYEMSLMDTTSDSWPKNTG